MKYRPILVFYYHDRDRMGDSEKEKIKEFAIQKGYEVLLWAGVKEENERVEIISMDSATVITNLQEYIDNIKKEIV